ncbi:MAG: porin [Vicinamibacterales bacterium]
MPPPIARLPSSGILACTIFLLLATAHEVHAQAPPPAAPPIVEAGLGRGVTVRSADDSSSMNIRARVQVRGTFSDNTDDALTGSTEAAIRRMRLVFQGNALGPRFAYYVQLGFSNQDTEADLRLPLRDAYLTWTATRDLVVRVGQMKVPFSRQRVVSSSALQMVDRSPVVAELNLDRDVGIQLFSKDLFGTRRLGYALGLFGGEGRNRLGRAAGALYSARVETWPFGPFDDFVESDHHRSRAFRLAIGANAAHNQNTNRPRSTTGDPYPAGDVDYTHLGVDATVKHRGCSATWEWTFRRADRETSTVGSGSTAAVVQARSGWGTFMQGGCLVTPRLELSARRSRLAPLRSRASPLVESDEYAVGVSHYPREHNLKLQADYGYEIAQGRHNHQIRSQLQLFF